MKVPLLNPSEGNKLFLEQLKKTASHVLESGQYILGKEVEDFERKFAGYLGVNHAVGVSSGTDALIASLIALGIGEGDEVICPAFTFFATAGAISRVGAIPVFADILPDCFTIDPEDIKRKITSKTAAIIPVHLFGQACKMDEISEIAEDNDLWVIEDAAQAIGCLYNGKMVGTLSDTGCFSFFPSKNLGGFGDAGLILTDSDQTARELKQARNHGMTAPYLHEFVGGNFRIDALQAALLKDKLDYLSDMERERRRHALLYSSGLEKTPLILPKQERGRHVYNQYTVRVPDGRRDELKQYLLDNNIACAVYYPIPLHQQPCFQHIRGKSLPITEKACEEVLSIPIAAEITFEQIKFVIETINNFFGVK